MPPAAYVVVLITMLLGSCGAEAPREDEGVIGGRNPARNTAASRHADDPDWARAESALLRNHVAVTTRERFLKAGEAYFSPDGEWIIFQAIEVPRAGEQPESFYQMYVARLRRVDGRVAGIEDPIRLSATGSSNTCGWFHPTEQGTVMFSSTIVPPSMQDVPGYQRGTGRYVWQFHAEMDIYRMHVPEVVTPGGGAGGHVEPIFRREGYDAEGSWSADGRFVLYAAFDRARSERLGRNHLDIMVYDTRTGRHHALVTAAGYNGGPFFSPDGRAICYRSDRAGDNLLQIYVARLRFEDGVPVGIEREHAITANRHVNWAPFWHPSGRFLVFGSSEHGHHNYEVIAAPVDFDALEDGLSPERIPRRRVTYAPGADLLPVFSPDGSLLMWTAQRGEPDPGEQRPSSQIWIAEWVGGDRFESFPPPR
jgi:Tol biopolymer transport system component